MVSKLFLDCKFFRQYTVEGKEEEWEEEQDLMAMM